MRCYAMTHPGLVRACNEDCCFIPQAGECFAAVCDGMGGHNAGEVASAMALDELRRALDGAQPGHEMLRGAIRRANSEVYDAAQHDDALSGMGTTLTVIWWDDERILMGHVGDSRLYRFDGERLTQLSRDHTYVQELADMGEITPAQARVHPRRNLITRSIGTQSTVEIDVAGFEREAGTAYLLCSDGLTNMLEDDEIRGILSRGEPEQQLNELLARSLERGGDDNITAVLAIDEEGMA